jgi:hypothetical protein
VNVDLKSLLSERADSVEAPQLDPPAVLDRGKRLVVRQRRRTAAVAVSAVAVVVLAVGLAAPGRDGRVSPARPSDPTRTTEPGARPLGYVQGRVLHLGARHIDTGLDAVSVDLTDDGAALTTLDGAIWFSDGIRVDRIGGTIGAGRISDGVTYDDNGGPPREWVVSDSEGSLLAWISAGPVGPELVVHDSSTGDTVLREPVPAPHRRDRPVVAAVAGRAAFVAVRRLGDSTEAAWFRVPVDGGRPQAIGREEFEAAIREVPRALSLGPPERGDVLGTSDGRPGHGVELDEAIGVRGQRLEDVFDPDAGAVVDIELPRDERAYEAYFLQWLDDDQFVVWSNGDLVACQLSEGQCRRVLDADWSFLDGDVMPLLPGDGGLGSDWALGRALKSVTGQR